MIATTHYSRPQVLERWRECIWADRVSDATMQNLVMPSLQVRHLRAGQSIWRMGDEALHWVGVLGGAAKLCVQLEDGRAVTLCSVAGSWIGEVELLRGVRHSCDAVALHDLTVVQIPRSIFEQLWMQQPLFQTFLMQLLAERNLQLMSLITAQQHSGTVARVARCLGALITPLNFPSERGHWLNVPQSELADYCNVSRSRLSEALSQLHRAGLIAVGYRSVQLVDLQGLRSFSGVLEMSSVA